jgi:hypothetical protein
VTDPDVIGAGAPREHRAGALGEREATAKRHERAGEVAHGYHDL